MTDEEKLLYKQASRLEKKAFDFKLDDNAKAALIGALAGGGLGAVSDFMTPKDEDENRASRLLGSILTGAAMGGLVGYGGQHFGVWDKAKEVGDNIVNDISTPSEPANDTAPAQDSWVERHLDPEASQVLKGTSAVTGAVGAKRLYNRLLSALGPQEGKSVLLNSKGRLIDRPTDRGAIRDLYDAFVNAESGKLSRVPNSVRTFFHNLRPGAEPVQSRQQVLDNAFEAALSAARSRGTAGAPGIRRGFGNNRRAVARALRSRGAGRLLGTSAATALAAALLKEFTANSK